MFYFSKYCDAQIEKKQKTWFEWKWQATGQPFGMAFVDDGDDDGPIVIYW